jgi:hypothetical protein
VRAMGSPVRCRFPGPRTKKTSPTGAIASTSSFSSVSRPRWFGSGTDGAGTSDGWITACWPSWFVSSSRWFRWAADGHLPDYRRTCGRMVTLGDVDALVRAGSRAGHGSAVGLHGCGVSRRMSRVPRRCAAGSARLPSPERAPFGADRTLLARHWVLPVHPHHRHLHPAFLRSSCGACAHLRRGGTASAGRGGRRDRQPGRVPSSRAPLGSDGRTTRATPRPARQLGTSDRRARRPGGARGAAPGGRGVGLARRASRMRGVGSAGADNARKRARRSSTRVKGGQAEPAPRADLASRSPP